MSEDINTLTLSPASHDKPGIIHCGRGPAFHEVHRIGKFEKIT